MSKPIPMLAEAIRNAIQQFPNGSFSPDVFAEAICRNLPGGLPIDGDVQGARAAIKRGSNIGEQVQDVFPVLIDKTLISEVLSFVLRNALSGGPNSGVTFHKNSSSVATGDESVGEVATPSRREITVRGVRTCNSDGVDLIVSAATGDWNPVRFRFLNVASVRCDEPEWKISCDDWEPMP